jgi:hypothetical protein
MHGMNLFVPITKVDVAKQEVWGRAAHEVPDKVGELFDYLGSKPYFETWSKSFSDATDGKSLGNIRAMHGKVAAGKAIAMNFNDAEKAIDIGTKIVDSNEWAKVLDGVYTGFSIGGSYIGDKKTEKIGDREVKRYIASPSEISLVDNPCIPSAKFFDVLKADGTIEKVAFKPAPLEVSGTNEEVAEFAKTLNDGGLSMADAIKIVKAHPGKVEKLTPADAVKALKPDEIVELLLPALIASSEAVAKADEPTLRKMAAESLTLEQIAALAPAGKFDAAKARAAVLKAKMSTANMDRLQAAHDHLAAMGANCDGDTDKAAPNGDLQKVATLEGSLQAALDRIEKLEKQPMPFVTLRTTPVPREKDGPAATKNAETDVQLTEADYIRNADGSVDYATSRFIKQQKASAAS